MAVKEPGMGSAQPCSKVIILIFMIIRLMITMSVKEPVKGDDTEHTDEMNDDHLDIS